MAYNTIRTLLEDTQLPADIVSWLERHAPEQFAALKRYGATPLYRGIKGGRVSADAQLVDSSGLYRPARNVGDFYKHLLSAANPDWPDRSYSTICTTSRHTARLYGDMGTYHIIPPDDAVIAVLGWDDLHATPILSLTYGDIQGAVALVDRLIHTNSDRPNSALIRTGSKLDRLSAPSGAVSAHAIDGLFVEWADAVSAALEDVRPDRREFVTGVLIGDNAGGFTTQGFHRGGNKTIDWLAARLFDGDKTPYSRKRASYDDIKYESLGGTMTTARALVREYVPYWQQGKERGDNECWFGGPFVAIRRVAYTFREES